MRDPRRRAESDVCGVALASFRIMDGVGAIADYAGLFGQPDKGTACVDVVLPTLDGPAFDAVPEDSYAAFLEIVMQADTFGDSAASSSVGNVVIYGTTVSVPLPYTFRLGRCWFFTDAQQTLRTLRKAANKARDMRISFSWLWSFRLGPYPRQSELTGRERSPTTASAHGGFVLSSAELKTADKNRLVPIAEVSFLASDVCCLWIQTFAGAR